MGRLLITTDPIVWRDLTSLLDSPTRVSFSSEAKKAIQSSHNVLKKILKSDQQVYGVNTGFGKLSTVSIDQVDLKQLQLNLVRSHACGVGKPLDMGVTRITMVLKLMTW